MTALPIILAVPVLLWLPWWALPIFAFVVGLVLTLDWRGALKFAAGVAVITVALAFLFDYQSQHLISRRMGGVFSAPSWIVEIAPAILWAWTALFFSRMGGAIRRLILIR